MTIQSTYLQYSRLVGSLVVDRVSAITGVSGQALRTNVQTVQRSYCAIPWDKTLVTVVDAIRQISEVGVSRGRSNVERSDDRGSASGSVMFDM